jgi:hypothetical protein
MTREEEWADPEIQLLLMDLKHSIERFLHRKLDVSDNQIEEEPKPSLLKVPAPRHRVSAGMKRLPAIGKGSISASAVPPGTPTDRRLAL